MQHSANRLKAYYVIGQSVWFIARWTFFIGLFFLLFRLGGEEGTFIERVRNLEPPRIRLIFPAGSRSPIPPPATGDLGLQYYTVVISSESSRTGAELVAGRLRNARINSKIIAANGGYAVTVGEFATTSEAGKKLEQVRKHGFISSSIAGTSPGPSGQAEAEKKLHPLKELAANLHHKSVSPVGNTIVHVPDDKEELDSIMKVLRDLNADPKPLDNRVQKVIVTGARGNEKAKKIKEKLDEISGDSTKTTIVFSKS